MGMFQIMPTIVHFVFIAFLVSNFFFNHCLQRLSGLKEYLSRKRLHCLQRLSGLKYLSRILIKKLRDCIIISTSKEAYRFQKGGKIL